MRRAGIHTRILVLTLRDATEDRVPDLGADADDYSVKLFAFAELLARGRALSRRDPAVTCFVLEISDFKVDLIAKSACLCLYSASAGIRQEEPMMNFA